MSKVAFNQLKTQAAKDKRIAENKARQLKMATDAGLTNPQVAHGYIRTFKTMENLTASTGRSGKRYFVSVYTTDLDPNGQVLDFNVYTYAPGMLKRYDAMEALKDADKATKTRKLSGTVIFGNNPKTKRNRLDLAAIFLDDNKQQAPAPAATPATPAPAAAPVEAPADDLPSDLPF